MPAVALHNAETPALFVTRFEAKPEDWAATPEVIRRGIETLWEENQRFREQLGQTSRNSSRPPSTDPPQAPTPAPAPNTPTGRRAGGQPGHADTNRPHIPEEQVTKSVPCHPTACAHCGHALSVADCAPTPHQRHQVVDLPPVVAEVIEYARFRATCPQCGAATTAPLPAGVPTGGYGPGVTALATLCTGAYHLSKRVTADLLTTVCQVPISVATIQRLEQTMSAALAAPWQAVADAVQQATHVHLDETGWRQQRDPDPSPRGTPPETAEATAAATGAEAPDATPTAPPKKAWLWVVVCQVAILFLIRRSRGSQVVKELLGAAFGGLLSSDRWSAYNWMETLRRQLCWAHLLRDFVAMSERGGAAGRLGEALLDQTALMFDLWCRVRDGTLSHPDFQRAMAPIQAEIGRLLRAGATPAGSRTAATCQWLVDHEAALWTFVRVAGIPPTNNRAEQAIRAAVIWRKLCFGTQTSAGSRYVERVLTVVATCKLQRRSVLEYLTTVAQAAYAGTPSPSLLTPVS